MHNIICTRSHFATLSVTLDGVVGL